MRFLLSLKKLFSRVWSAMRGINYTHLFFVSGVKRSPKRLGGERTEKRLFRSQPTPNVNRPIFIKTQKARRTTSPGQFVFIN